MKETQADINRAMGYALLLHGLLLALVILILWWTRDTMVGVATGSAIEADLVDSNSLSAAMRRAMRTSSQPEQLQMAPPPRPIPASIPEGAPVKQPVAQALIEVLDTMEQERLEQRAETNVAHDREQEEKKREQQLADARKLLTEQLKQLTDLQPQRAAETSTEADVTSNASPSRGNNGVDADLLARYQAALQDAILRNWTRPGWVPLGEHCKLVINQNPGGEVIEVQVDPSCPYDELARRSIEAAVLMAQPLPYSGFESVFQRVLILDFEALQR